MEFNTITFFLFFSAVFFWHWSVRKSRQWMVLLAASYAFYAFWTPLYLGILMAVTAANYAAAVAISRADRLKQLLLILSVSVNVAVLMLFKYFGFFFEHTAALLHQLHLSSILPEANVLIPLGISFYTLQVIGYLVDVYRGTVQPETHPGHFALFVSYFPQIVSGPIHRSRELLPQFKYGREFSYDEAAGGLKLFAFGLFKKMVIADNLARIVNPSFNPITNVTELNLILVLILFSWQIYMDFSGYTDMARGISHMFGIRLSINFDAPYRATSLRDFWRRWHMSLSGWLRDYLYIPLGGDRKGLLRTCLNTLVVFLVCGLWHGTSATFILWGTFHGFMVSAERIMENRIRVRIPVGIKRVYAYGVVTVSWIFFRSQSVDDIFYIFGNAFSDIRGMLAAAHLRHSLAMLFSSNALELCITAFVLLAAVAIESVPRAEILTRLNSFPPVVRYGIYILLLLAIVQLRDTNIKKFVYMGF